MKKIILLTSMITMTSVANAQTEYYFSTKMGIGDTDIYVDNDTKFTINISKGKRVYSYGCDVFVKYTKL